MSTEDLYQEEVENLDDDDQTVDEVNENDHAHEDEYGLEDDPTWQDSEPADDEQSQPAPEPAAFESLALDLTLRCGQIKLTLAELRRLDAGTILEVAGIAPGYATLCHGERVVAEGELVDVDGRLGLQITRMVKQP
ncbi:FliM/FliN family flagellar motor switch protein [Pseudomonas cannabina]|uniref:FliM/FliN family flagellar motor switch protein n=1 Tax=Pseudomonas cannabina TaxID=86840 RepID=UPI0006D6184D|nr:FliM/FliN family flagellar motor switch protein [Pseudomonas cannabina]KAA8712079.1 type III secretion system protein [Pseudomonas cannabina]SDQ50301.1 type III secretion protein Q [Pseudomonas cannabina]